MCKHPLDVKSSKMGWLGLVDWEFTRESLNHNTAILDTPTFSISYVSLHLATSTGNCEEYHHTTDSYVLYMWSKLKKMKKKRRKRHVSELTIGCASNSPKLYIFSPSNADRDKSNAKS